MQNQRLQDLLAMWEEAPESGFQDRRDICSLGAGAIAGLCTASYLNTWPTLQFLKFNFYDNFFMLK
jgi:hypothetical protein